MVADGRDHVPGLRDPPGPPPNRRRRRGRWLPARDTRCRRSPSVGRVRGRTSGRGRQHLYVPQRAASADAERQRLAGSQAREPDAPVLEGRHRLPTGGLDHVAHRHDSSRGPGRVHPCDDDASTRAGRRRDVRCQRLHVDPDVTRRARTRPTRRSPPARTSAAGTIARRPPCSTTMPANSPAVVNTNEPGTSVARSGDHPDEVGPHDALDRIEGRDEDRPQRDAFGRRLGHHQESRPLGPPWRPRDGRRARPVPPRCGRRPAQRPRRCPARDRSPPVHGAVAAGNNAIARSSRMRSASSRAGGSCAACPRARSRRARRATARCAPAVVPLRTPGHRTLG